MPENIIELYKQEYGTEPFQSLGSFREKLNNCILKYKQSA